MDILGGSGICRGSRNPLANFYIAMPMPITIEGSNILTHLNEALGRLEQAFQLYEQRNGIG